MPRRSRIPDADNSPLLRFAPGDETALLALRGVLLHHHRQLVDLARRDYERGHGRVSSGSELVSLLMGDPAFGWLRMLSSLIARLDEILEEPKDGEAETIVETASRLMLALDENDGGFQARYRQALQESPDVILSHGRLAANLRALRRTRFHLQPAS